MESIITALITLVIILVIAWIRKKRRRYQWSDIEVDYIASSPEYHDEPEWIELPQYDMTPRPMKTSAPKPIEMLEIKNKHNLKSDAIVTVCYRKDGE